ncbi:MAG: hypothetical protein IT294_08395 [Deltaproteobacteria bacterium]|nr:hypothetical protein [Deltaproteobacteria bacterium]
MTLPAPTSAAPAAAIPMTAFGGVARPAMPEPHGARDALALLFTVVAVYWLTCPGATAYDQYSRFADALLHGSLSLSARPPHLEMAEYGGRAYFTNPPTPAILIAPFLWIAEREPLRSWLVARNGGWDLPFGWFQTGLSIACGALATVFARLALGRIPVSRLAANLGAILFAFGGIHWYHATIGSVWYLAQIVHGMFLWILVWEWFGKARPLLIGTCLAFAFWCRMETLVAMPFALVPLASHWLHPRTDEIVPRPRLGWLVKFALPIVAVLALNSAYNYARFGVFGNAAYEVLINKGKGDPLFPKGLMHWSYWPGHVYVLFNAKPLFYDEYPWILSGVGGLSWWYTTPAFLYALKAPWDRWTLGCWVGILLFLGILFQFGGTGMTQLGYRFALDFYAPLTVLTVRGMDQGLSDAAHPIRGRLAWILSSLVAAVAVWFAPWAQARPWSWVAAVLLVGFVFDTTRPIRPWHVALILACVAVNAWWTISLNLLNLGRLF